MPNLLPKRDTGGSSRERARSLRANRGVRRETKPKVKTRVGSQVLHGIGQGLKCGGVPERKVLLTVFDLFEKPASVRRIGGVDRAVDKVDVLAAFDFQMLVLAQVQPARRVRSTWYTYPRIVE